MKKDIVIIGAGPGGYEAAIEGAKLGHNITLIDPLGVGGTCLHWGCIPTKTYYKQSKFLYDAKRAGELGFSYDNLAMDYNQLISRKDKVIELLESGILKTLKSLGVHLISGTARIKDNQVMVKCDDDHLILEPEIIVIATGSKSKLLPIDGCQLEGVLTSKELLALPEIPKKLTIIGAGVIGLEFASIYNQLGSKVTVIEYLDNVLPTHDLAISKRLISYMKNQGITIMTGIKAESIIKEQEVLKLNYTKELKNTVISETIESDYILMAVGRTGNITTFDGMETDIRIENNFIMVDDNLETSTKNIYAIGDINGKNMLAHGAAFQGKWLMKYLDGSKEKLGEIMPSAVFTIPEVASVGLTEEQIKEKGLPYNSYKTMFGTLGKAHAIHETDGFIKIMTDEKDKILGVHIIGSDASNLIQEAVIAISQHMSLKELKSLIHVHPTLSEIYL